MSTNLPPVTTPGGLYADLTGRVAVVTGASSGLGSRFAEVLARAGATVVAAARREDRLADLASRVRGVEPARCDVTDDEDRESLVSGVLERHGRIDVLVNNAGQGGTATALDEPLHDFESSIALNLTAPFALTQLCGRAMVEQGSGSVINIASILGLGSGAPVSQPSYAASKGGIINLTKELAASLGHTGVRVNAIAPGWFDTAATTTMFNSERGQQWMTRNTPMRRCGQEGELDGALLLLASDASSFMTGHTLVVDGGWTAR